MMKTLLVAINSQFVHTNLAVLYLKAACSGIGNTEILEFTVNEPINRIYSRIISENPDVVCFSCYIWNIEVVSKLSDDLKKAMPGIIIIAGGPEVSFENGGLLAENRNVDYIIAGEGEEKLPWLLNLIKDGRTPGPEEIQWLKSYSEIKNLENLRLPYTMIEKGSLKNRIAYIEASRGCPFRCAYCISSVTKGVRYFPLEKVYEAIEILSESGSEIIKFVDRTFNCNEERALNIWQYILKFRDKGMVFHFEIDPGLLTDDMLKCLEKMPEGLVQVEAGIQSVHRNTLSAVQRPDNTEKAFDALKRLIFFGNIHVHVDLIAGLPYESYGNFRISFNRVYSLFAHRFQLGFLKLLRGSELKNRAERFGICYRSYPPYEIIGNSYISPAELVRLKDIEECLELFYNSGRFMLTMKILYYALGEPFAFYEKLSSYMRQKGYLDRSVGAGELYWILYDYVKQEYPFIANDIAESLRYDYLSSMKRPTLPEFLQKNDYSLRKEKEKLISQHQNRLKDMLPRLKFKSLNEIWHQIYISEFKFENKSEFLPNGLMVFDFGDISPVTGLAKSYPLGME
ncbi:cobalamin B12-binding/radical SAM domain-containing protein [Thermoclostridium stercorarium subsp. stercorarium DSM 8532]|uniref:Cobalamin B12-binding/radical SAM domain-containing protein n=5 Tax=Thermoclostridium stercorarium TaxID=1510 RepID=L7VLU3_THES1|nr:B12-binding domain-containing radical SAM protein [Thermoclostridium stercorarium]AGC67604.1 cobalamin B12-binding/radical SAM domain-containing protein [Thermoclostridium stercorarium subsp. stercorarium DSM 8532]ANW98026.1 cobalamin B12-binding/radical SAM domain-containing protein [Thermoclostridium stercorarium subsp. thermolacticum DSM 2910]ANX00574.1 cobalamin B12-binding/radical SAM domain-containing protein [Thermoclostridium stercorarium subsp. leptospartum DSM 9219]